MRGNSRIINILKTFELTDRLLLSTTDISQINWEKAIDWRKVNEIKKAKVAESKMFLKNAIA